MRKLLLTTVLSPVLVLALLDPGRSGATHEEAIRVTGLIEGVRLIEDSDGVPHIYAQNDHDAVFMTGYLHARDRFFQMDVLRRTIGGTLAELLGEAALASDIQLRTLGLRRAAEASLPAYSPTLQQLFEAYADGVNAYLNDPDHPLPPEYGALELASVRPWAPLDSLSVAKGLAFQLSFDLDDLSRTTALAAFQEAGQDQGFDGSGLFADLFRHAPADPSISIRGFFPDPAPQQAAVERRLPQVSSHLEAATLNLIDRYLEKIGDVPFLSSGLHDTRRAASNWWVMGPSLTENGYPLLAHDPHLALDSPATFYEIHLNSSDPVNGPMNVNGVSLAGTPGVVLGCNERICWGATVNPMDVTDSYQELLVVDLGQLLPTHTLFEGRREELVTIPQEYLVNRNSSGSPDDLESADVGPLEGGLTFLVPRRNMGPIVAVELGFPVTAISVQYSGFSPTREVEAFYRWSRARDVEDFKEGLQYFDFGSQNFSYADIDGNIAYFTSAEMPLREDLQNLGQVDGMPPFLVRDGTHIFQNEWLPLQNPQPIQALPYEILPFDEMPQIVNPPNGFVANANNDPVGTTLDNDVLNETRLGGGVYYLSPGYSSLRMGRVQRLIEEAVGRGRPIAAAEVTGWQSNNQMLDAELLLPHLLAAQTNLQAAPLGEAPGDPEVDEALQRLAAWDFSTPTGLVKGYDPGDDPENLPMPSQEEIDASVAATIYSVWRGQIIANTIDATLVRSGLAGLGADSERTISSLLHLLDDFENSGGIGQSGLNFFEVEGASSAQEARDTLLLRSLRDALDLLAGEPFASAFANSTDQNDYRWGRLHRIVFDHPLGGPFDIPPAAAFADLAPQLKGLARSGGYETVDASSHSARAASANAYMFGAGAARRFSGELDPEGISALEIIPGGQSGVLGAPHYASQLARWLTHQFHPLRLTRSDVDADVSSTLLLGPPEHRLFFPYYQADASSFAGFAASDLLDSAQELTFNARDEAGLPLPFTVNPSAQSLGPTQQLALLGSDIFEISQKSDQSGWIELTALGAVPETGPPLASFTQFGTFKLSRLDGGRALTFAGNQLVFPSVFEGSDAFEGLAAVTQISLVNPNPGGIEVQMSLFGGATVPAGNGNTQPSHQATIEIPAGGFLFGSISELFGASIEVSDGYLTALVSGGRGAAGFQVIHLSDHSTVLGLNAIRPGFLVDSYSAQFAASPQIFTRVKLINASETARHIQLTTSGEVTLDGPEEIELAPGESFRVGAAAPLEATGSRPSGSATAEGSLHVEADGDGIVGSVIFGDPEGDFGAALPLQRQTFKKAVFSHVANQDNFFTGLALTVPGAEAATVTVEVYNRDGELVGTTELEIAGGERESGLLSDFVPETAEQAGGYIVICSTEPLVGQQLFGTFGLSLLSAVPPTIIE